MTFVVGSFFLTYQEIGEESQIEDNYYFGASYGWIILMIIWILIGWPIGPGSPMNYDLSALDQ